MKFSELSNMVTKTIEAINSVHVLTLQFAITVALRPPRGRGGAAGRRAAGARPTAGGDHERGRSLRATCAQYHRPIQTIAGSNSRNVENVCRNIPEYLVL